MVGMSSEVLTMISKSFVTDDEEEDDDDDDDYHQDESEFAQDPQCSRSSLLDKISSWPRI